MDFYEAFAHTWGSTGTVDDSLTATQYDQGWNFIGSRPPRLGEFNKREKLIDQRLKWLYDQLKTAADAHGVTLAGADVGGLLAILQDLIGDHTSALDPHAQYQLESGMSAYAPRASPALTGTPTAPTAPAGTNTTQIATTAFVQAARPPQATQAEMEAGTEANVRSMSPLRVAQAIAALGASGIGKGQTWTDVKASRAYGVTYTNSTGKPIEVFVTNSGGSVLLQATVGSVVLGQQMSTYNTSTPRQCFSFVVPNAATYRVDCTGTLEYWTELR